MMPVSEDQKIDSDRSLRFVFCRDVFFVPPSFARDEGAPAKEETEEFNDFGLREVPVCFGNPPVTLKPGDGTTDGTGVPVKP